MILLDTHVPLWIDRDDASLGPSCRELIETSWREGPVLVSAISFREVAMLAVRGRLELPCSVTTWRSNWWEARLRELPPDGSITLQPVSLAPLHPDPVDRFLVASTQAIQATLVTADQAILDWVGPLTRHDART